MRPTDPAGVRWDTLGVRPLSFRRGLSGTDDAGGPDLFCCCVGNTGLVSEVTLKPPCRHEHKDRLRPHYSGKEMTSTCSGPEQSDVPPRRDPPTDTHSSPDYASRDPDRVVLPPCLLLERPPGTPAAVSCHGWSGGPWVARHGKDGATEVSGPQTSSSVPGTFLFDGHTLSSWSPGAWESARDDRESLNTPRPLPGTSRGQSRVGPSPGPPADTWTPTGPRRNKTRGSANRGRRA